MGKTTACGTVATMAVCGNISLTVNIVLSEIVTEFNADIIETNSAIGALNLRVKYWTILHSRWTEEFLDKCILCRPMFSY
jgi:hypothetical protein